MAIWYDGHPKKVTRQIEGYVCKKISIMPLYDLFFVFLFFFSFFASWKAVVFNFLGPQQSCQMKTLIRFEAPGVGGSQAHVGSMVQKQKEKKVRNFFVWTQKGQSWSH